MLILSPYLKKQFIIAFIYLIIIGAIGGGIFLRLFYAPPSCQDGELNQGEEKIDCGGPCVECQEELFALDVLWKKAFLVEGDQYDLVAQIENKNTNYGSGLVPYIFKIYDVQNNLIAKKQGKNYVMPREKKYIIESVALSVTPLKIELEFDDISWQKFKFNNVTGGNLNLPIFGQKFSREQKDGKAAFVEGTVFNKTDYDLDAIDINVVIYDSRGLPIAANKTQKNIVRVGEGSYFQMFWPSLPDFDETEAKIDIKAHTNAFSDENFIRTFFK